MYSKAKLSEILLEHRTKQGKTQYDCAFACDVSVESYRKWENGISVPSDRHYNDLCKFLNITEAKE